MAVCFLVKINDAAKRVGMRVEFVKDKKLALEKIAARPPLSDLRSELCRGRPCWITARDQDESETAGIKTIAFVSHVQTDLKREAEAAGCDVVVARSVFAQNLEQILRGSAIRQTPKRPSLAKAAPESMGSAARLTGSGISAARRARAALMTTISLAADLSPRRIDSAIARFRSTSPPRKLQRADCGVKPKSSGESVSRSTMPPRIRKTVEGPVMVNSPRPSDREPHNRGVVQAAPARRRSSPRPLPTRCRPPESPRAPDS